MAERAGLKSRLKKIQQLMGVRASLCRVLYVPQHFTELSDRSFRRELSLRSCEYPAALDTLSAARRVLKIFIGFGSASAR